jgi:hypothetical protein
MDITTQGSVTYHLQFLITDGNGNVLGCFQWDPFVTISARTHIADSKLGPAMGLHTSP